MHKILLIIFNYNLGINQEMHRESLIRNPSKTLLASQLYTHSKLDCNQQSAEKILNRKNTASTCSTVLNIDKLVQDVKISHIQQNKYSQHIAIIMKELESLKSLPHVKDEIVTIELLLDSINKKIMSGSHSRERKLQSSVKKSIIRQSNRKEESSPIRDIDDASSIVYTQFSLKNMSHQTSMATSDASLALQTPKKTSAQDEYSNREMDKLNNQILLLEKLLKNKGLQGAPTNSFQNSKPINTSNTKLSSYRNSQNLCGPVRKNLFQKCKWNNSKQNMSQCSKLKMVQSKFR